MDESLFKELGFTNNEIKVYLALSKIGTVTIGAIQKKTGLHAPRVYESLEKLIKKGLVSSFVLNRKKHFCAAEPSRIKFFIHEKIDIAEQIISQIPRTSPKQASSNIEVFIGKEGMKTIAEDELTSNAVYVLWGSPHFQEKFTYYRPNFQQRRIKKKIKMQAIFASRHKDYALNFAKLPYTDVRFLPYELPITVILYRDRLVIVCWSNDIIAFRIVDQELVNDALKQFISFWKISKKVI